MAKKKTATKTEEISYLYGTFIGNGSISISADTSSKEVESFLKANPKLEARIKNADLIRSQRALIKK